MASRASASFPELLADLKQARASVPVLIFFRCRIDHLIELLSHAQQDLSASSSRLHSEIDFIAEFSSLVHDCTLHIRLLLSPKEWLLGRSSVSAVDEHQSFMNLGKRLFLLMQRSLPSALSPSSSSFNYSCECSEQKWADCLVREQKLITQRCVDKDDFVLKILLESQISRNRLSTDPPPDQLLSLLLEDSSLHEIQQRQLKSFAEHVYEPMVSGMESGNQIHFYQILFRQRIAGGGSVRVSLSLFCLHLSFS